MTRCALGSFVVWLPLSIACAFDSEGQEGGDSDSSGSSSRGDSSSTSGHGESGSGDGTGSSGQDSDGTDSGATESSSSESSSGIGSEGETGPDENPGPYGPCPGGDESPCMADEVCVMADDNLFVCAKPCNWFGDCPAFEGHTVKCQDFSEGFQQHCAIDCAWAACPDTMVCYQGTFENVCVSED